MPSPTKSSTPEHKSWAKWLGPPFWVAIVGGFFTISGVLFQGIESLGVDQKKFQYELIKEALAVGSQTEAAARLRFLIRAKLVDNLGEEDVSPERLPVFHGAALRDGIITVTQAKEVLRYLGYYSGAVDDEFDLYFQIALTKFQKDVKLKGIDGLLGGETVLALWEACTECPAYLLKNAKKYVDEKKAASPDGPKLAPRLAPSPPKP